MCDQVRLTAALDEIDRISDAEWASTLDERKRKELEFHDRDRDRQATATMDEDTFEKLYGNRKYYQGVGLSRAYTDRWIAERAPGKVFLDYACGNGSNAMKAAQAGAALSLGLDISRVSIVNARADAAALNLQNARFVQADAENTKLPDASVDVIVCSGMLHHLDLNFAFPELERILAPGGRILAIEALDYNPLIRLYRKITPQMRTDWEKAHILSFKDLKLASRFFTVANVRFWHISSIATPLCPPLLPVFNAVDGILTKIPLVRRLAWIFTFELLKK